MLAVSVFLLRWAWQTAEPLWPVGLGLVVVIGMVMLVVRYHRNRYW